ncbi:hypothetical protein [Ramlibacter sp.]
MHSFALRDSTRSTERARLSSLTLPPAEKTIRLERRAFVAVTGDTS